jgi:hypothetical protein
MQQVVIQFFYSFIYFLLLHFITFILLRKHIDYQNRNHAKRN